MSLLKVPFSDRFMARKSGQCIIYVNCTLHGCLPTWLREEVPAYKALKSSRLQEFLEVAYSYQVNPISTFCGTLYIRGFFGTLLEDFHFFLQASTLCTHHYCCILTSEKKNLCLDLYEMFALIFMNILKMDLTPLWCL